MSWKSENDVDRSLNKYRRVLSRFPFLFFDIVFRNCEKEKTEKTQSHNKRERENPIYMFFVTMPNGPPKFVDVQLYLRKQRKIVFIF